ncbi:hypothetical protein TNCV_168021 [Trichonephila clavipes]|nr:hypothetical protein TNCV_168021 [Trichonephila clavipes]
MSQIYDTFTGIHAFSGIRIQAIRSTGLSSFRVLGAGDLQAPLAQEDRNLYPESLVKCGLSGPLGARLKHPVDKLALRHSNQRR